MKILGGKNSDLNINNHNIYIGISLGNSFFDEENIKKYIEFGLKNTNKNFVILIADSIQLYNYVWQRKCSFKKANLISINESNNKKIIITNILEKYFGNNTIDIICWNDLMSENHEKDLVTVFNEYNKKSLFYNNINNFVSKYIKQIGRTVNAKSIKFSAEYILREIPFLVKGFSYDNNEYTCYPYPSIGVGEILVNIQNNKYSNLLELLNIDKLAIQVVLNNK